MDTKAVFILMIAYQIPLDMAAKLSRNEITMHEVAIYRMNNSNQ